MSKLIKLSKHLLFEGRKEAEKVVPLNSIRKIKLEDRIYGIANNSGGYWVFKISCPHAGADLTTGRINHLGELVCPLHAYIFNFLDGEEERRRCPPVATYATYWQEEKLYVDIK